MTLDDFRPLIQRASKILSVKVMFSLAIRIGAAVGKFAFVLFAAGHMSLPDLGRFGFIASTCLLMSGLIGLEIYQIITRAVATGTATDTEKANYGAFSLAASFLLFVASLVLLTALGWSPTDALMGGAIVAAEHFGNEQFRCLAAEKRGDLALQSFSLRSGLWSLGLPALSLVHLAPEHWSLFLVLATWLGSDVLSLFYLRYLPKAYRPDWRAFAALAPWLVSLIPHSATWLVISMAGRFLESGSRLVGGFSLSPDTAGRFTFLATLGGISTTVAKGMIEPLLFARLSVPANHNARRNYGLLMFATSIAAPLGGTVILFFYNRFSNFHLSMADYGVFALISLHTLFLNMSQYPHFVLYAERQDRMILYASALAICVGVPVTVAGGFLGGPAGLAAGFVVGSGVMLGSKSFAAYRHRKALQVDKAVRAA